MKIRVFQGMEDSVFRVLIATEDWSEGDIDLINQFGEPEVNIGGEIDYEFDGSARKKTFGDMFVRVWHGFPLSRGFDSRDYRVIDDLDRIDEDKSVQEAVVVGRKWKEMVLERIESEVRKLREHTSPLPTEEVSEI